MLSIVAITGNKRLETVPVKFSNAEKEELRKIAEAEDRPLGYVVRELAFRGLNLYRKDGSLRALQGDAAEGVLSGDLHLSSKKKEKKAG